MVEGIRNRPGAWVLASLLWCWACESGPGLEPPGSGTGSADVAPMGGSSQTPTSAPGIDTPTLDGGMPAAGEGDDGPGMAADGDGAPTGGSGSTPEPGSSLDATGDEDAGVEPFGEVGDPQGAALFRGVWAVEQPSHALYEATVYELREDGELLEHDTVIWGPPIADFVTGTVRHDASAVECRFSARWRALSPREVSIEGQCDDGASREIRLRFPAGDPAAGLVPERVLVDGEEGWGHPGFMWSFRKCAGREGCVQTL